MSCVSLLDTVRALDWQLLQELPSYSIHVVQLRFVLKVQNFLEVLICEQCSEYSPTHNHRPLHKLACTNAATIVQVVHMMEGSRG
jgi:hypothetical protein